MITLAADVGAVSENHLAALGRPAALAAAAVKRGSGGEGRRPGSLWREGSALGGHSQHRVVPQDTDGFRALLSGDQAELHGDGLVQVVLQQFVVVVDGDADHRRVDDRALWHTKNNKPSSKPGADPPSPKILSMPSTS